MTDRSPCAETAAVVPDITALLLADLVEAGVDEPIARTLLTLAARTGENMRLNRENAALREAAKAVILHWEGMVDDHPDRAGWDFAETIDTLRAAAQSDGSRAQSEVTHPDTPAG